MATSQHELIDRLVAGDRRALAKAISAVEFGGESARAILAAAYRHTGRAAIVGITGPPGAGKSTLVNALAREWRSRDQRVGIIAVDPSSPFTGGAVLGDRIRMQPLAGDPGIFIRSMASRGRLGGLARATADAAALLDAAGFAIVIIETVGAGQGEVDIARAAMTTIVVEVPGMGDDVQADKAGVLEIADLFVVNKADRDGAQQTIRHLKQMLQLGGASTGWEVPVLSAVAMRNEGIAAIVDGVVAHLAHLATSGEGAARQRAAAAREVAAAVQELALERAHAAGWAAAIDAATTRRADPYSLAEELLKPTNG